MHNDILFAALRIRTLEYFTASMKATRIHLALSCLTCNRYARFSYTVQPVLLLFSRNTNRTKVSFILGSVANVGIETGTFRIPGWYASISNIRGMKTEDNSIKTRTAGFPKNDGIDKPKYTVSHPVRLRAVGTSHLVTSVGLTN